MTILVAPLPDMVFNAMGKTYYPDQNQLVDAMDCDMVALLNAGFRPVSSDDSTNADASSDTSTPDTSSDTSTPAPAPTLDEVQAELGQVEAELAAIQEAPSEAS